MFGQLLNILLYTPPYQRSSPNQRTPKSDHTSPSMIFLSSALCNHFTALSGPRLYRVFNAATIHRLTIIFHLGHQVLPAFSSQIAAYGWSYCMPTSVLLDVHCGKKIDKMCTTFLPMKSLLNIL